MRISNFTTKRPEMSSTRTAGDFMAFLGQNPTRLGVVSQLYDQYTATHLTEALFNTFTKDKEKSAYKGVDGFMVEWNINVNRIKRVPMTAVPTGNGANGSDVVFHFNENYYQLHEVFVVEDTRQQFIVMERPQRISDNDFAVICKINDNDYNSVVDTSGTYVGANTRFITNNKPEMHSEGYTKYQSNIEAHRIYIATHRTDVDMSAQYAAMEDVFCTVSNHDKDGKKSDVVFRLEPAKKACLDSFMEARNNASLWSKTNIDENGHSKIKTAADGQPIISSDGIIPQIERFATKFVINKLSMPFFQNAMTQMVLKSEKPVGNNYVFMCNTAMWNEFQRVGQSWIRDFKTNGTFAYSKAAGGNVALGATYQSYEHAGNTVIIRVERSLDIEFPNRKFGMFLDLTADSANGNPALGFYTFKRGEIVHNHLTGVGGLSGFDHGAVSSPVAASKYINFGYGAVAVFNPYRSVIIQGHKESNYLF